MTFLELAESRYSVRSFSDQPIEPEKMDAILKAAQLAPTAANRQPQVIYILQSPDALAKAKEVTHYVFNAPVVFLLCVDEQKVWHSRWEEGYDSGDMDVSIVCTHMMMEAWELGIGSVWVRGFDARVAKNVFDLPEHIRPICMLPIGYPDENSKPANFHYITKELSEFVIEL